MPRNLYVRDNNRRLEFTAHEERFIREMIVNPDTVTNAAIRAGYSPLCAATVGDSLMGKAHVVFAIEEGRKTLRDELARQSGVSLADVVKLLVDVATYDPADFYDEHGNLRPIDEIPKAARMAIEGIDSEEIHEGRGMDRRHVADVRKLKYAKRSVYLDMLMRHLGGYELDNQQKMDPVADLIREINGRRSSLQVVDEVPK